MEHCKNGHIRNEESTYINPKTGRRVCRVCHKLTEYKRLHKSPENIQKNRDRVKAWRETFPDRAKQVRSNWLSKLKETILSAKSVGCMNCPEKDPDCLDFHHRDPNKKLYNIGLSFGSISHKRLIKEIAKCDVLCSNCHRKLEASIRKEKQV